MTYRVELSALARTRLGALSPPVQARILEHLTGLADDPSPPATEWLTGPLRGLRKVRVGDYRVVYEVDEPGRLVHVATVGHRHTVYKEAQRLRR